MTTKPTSAIEQARAAVQRLDEEKKKELTDRQAKLESCENLRERLQTAINTAANAGDDAAYLKAKRELRDVEDEIELHTRRIDILTNKKLVSDDTYNELIKKLHAYLDEKSAKAEAAATVHILEVLKIAKGLDSDITEANSIIDAWVTVTNVRKVTNGAFGSVTYTRRDLPTWAGRSAIHDTLATRITKGENEKQWQKDEAPAGTWRAKEG